MSSPSTAGLPAQDLDDRFGHLVRIAGQRAGRRQTIASDIKRLSKLFGAERADRSKDYLQSEAHRAAYLAFFTPRSAAQTALLIRRAIAEGHLPTRQAPRVLDLGSGPLSGVLGAWLAYGGLGASHAVDLSARALQEGRALVQEAVADAAITTENQSVTAPFAPTGEFDLVVLSHVLNEIGDPRRGNAARLAVLKRAFSKLAPGGRVLVVEPATRVHGRALMRLRDDIVADAMGAILSPCPRGVVACPLSERGSDWCHADLEWAPPEAFQRLTAAATLPQGPLKVSALLLAKDGQSPTGARLVGGVMRGGGQPEGRYACTPRGLVTLKSTRQQLPPSVGQPSRGAWLGGDIPAGVTVAAGEARPARTSGSRRRDQGRGGGGRRRRT